MLCGSILAVGLPRTLSCKPLDLRVYGMQIGQMGIVGKNKRWKCLGRATSNTLNPPKEAASCLHGTGTLPAILVRWQWASSFRLRRNRKKPCKDILPLASHGRAHRKIVRSVHPARLHHCDKERLRRILTGRFWRSFLAVVIYMMGLLRWLSGKESACQCRRHGFDPLSRISPGERNGNPLQYSCLGNLMDRGAWWAIVHRVAKELDAT